MRGVRDVIGWSTAVNHKQCDEQLPAGAREGRAGRRDPRREALWAVQPARGPGGRAGVNGCRVRASSVGLVGFC